ncbi:MAG TPA: ABC transporter substrate-binding protein [Candidatus Baltobacteraceae bacterium]|nr:ABC transporter substrate-binding protein [Candidatus Baltobacteraceae bacterium]
MGAFESRRSFLGGAVAVGLSAGVPVRARAAAPVVKLGYVDSLSGPFAVGGIPQLNGARLAVEEANRRGRVRYELVVADDATKPAVGTTAARRLVENEKVDVLLGGASSAVGNAISAYAENAGVLYLAVGTHDTAMTGDKANRVCFRQTCSLAMLTNALGAELVRRAKRWYFLVADYAFGTDARDRLLPILQAHGGRVAGMDLHAIGTNDFSPFMVKARATDADAFLLLNGGTDTQNAATAFVQFGLQKRMLAAGVTGENELAAGFPAEELAGSLWGYVWGPDAGGRAPQLHEKFVRAANGFPPNWRQYLGYMAVANIVDRMESAGTTDTATLVRAFENHRYDAAKAQPGVFRACDHQAMQETYCAEMLPRAKRRDPNEYFRIVSAVGGEFAAGSCSNPDSAKAAAIIGGEKIPAREGYSPVLVRA